MSARQRVLGVDWGERRIGLARTDESGGFVQPAGFIGRASDSQAAQAIAQEAARLGAGLIVMGLPLNMDGSEGPAAMRVRKVAARLERVAGLPVLLRDERLTSEEARQRLRQAGLRPGEIACRIDAAAAAILLEDYLAETAAPGLAPPKPREEP